MTTLFSKNNSLIRFPYLLQNTNLLDLFLLLLNSFHTFPPWTPWKYVFDFQLFKLHGEKSPSKTVGELWIKITVQHGNVVAISPCNKKYCVDSKNYHASRVKIIVL